MRPALRHCLLKLLAQTAPAAPIAPNTTSGPTTVAGSPTTFDPYSFYPSITTGWGSNNISWIRQLAHTLNNAIFILSNGQIDLNRLRGTNFIVDTSKYPDRILQGIVRFALQVYRLIFTDLTAPFTKPVDNRPQRIQMLKGFLYTFQIPDGGINQFMTNRIGGPFKTVILDTLSQIK